jgi:hypothetical protein
MISIIGEFLGEFIASLIPEPIKRAFNYIVSDQISRDFLFGGELKESHKTKFALEKIVDRYSESIESLNKSITVNLLFIPIAIFLTGSDIKIPTLEISIKYYNWLRLIPAISLGIQFFALISLAWFLMLRRGLHVLGEEIKNVEYYGDVSNAMLKGVAGTLWILVTIPRQLPTRLHRIWLIPAVGVFIILLLSPSLLCLYFVGLLFYTGDFVSAIVYSILLLPAISLALVLIGISALTGITEVLYE